MFRHGFEVGEGVSSALVRILLRRAVSAEIKANLVVLKSLESVKAVIVVFIDSFGVTTDCMRLAQSQPKSAHRRYRPPSFLPPPSTAQIDVAPLPVSTGQKLPSHRIASHRITTSAPSKST